MNIWSLREAISGATGSIIRLLDTEEAAFSLWQLFPYFRFGERRQGRGIEADISP